MLASSSHSDLVGNGLVKVLMVDCDTDTARLYGGLLKRSGYHIEIVRGASDLEIKISNDELKLVVMDCDRGEGLVQVIREKHPNIPILAMVKPGVPSRNSLLTEQGVSGFVFKNESPGNFIAKVSRLFGKRAKKDLSAEAYGLVGQSPSTRHLIEKIKFLNDGHVLIEGEKGTAKQYLANSIHKNSTTGELPCHILSCQIISSRKADELENLFKIGRRGTVLLQDIHEIPRDHQEHLYHYLKENSQIRAIGTSDIELVKKVEKGLFSPALFGLLSVSKLVLKPLRDRKEDVVPLFHFFLKKSELKYKRKVIIPNQRVMDRIKNFSWEGNEEQLQRSVEKAVLLMKTNSLDESHLFANSIREDKNSSSIEDITNNFLKDNVKYHDLRARIDRLYLKNLLQSTGGNIAEASRISGLYRANIYRMLDKYGIEATSYKGLDS